MSEYAIRTCARCGVKKPANEMTSKTVSRSGRGSSRRSVNPLTFIGAFFEDKGSRRAIRQWAFQSTNRKYKGEGTKEITLCYNCVNKVSSANSSHVLLKIIFFPFYLAYLIYIKIPFSILKFLFTSPLVKKIITYSFSLIVWIVLKIFKLLAFLGIKILDQDGDGNIDKNDFDIAYKRTKEYFQKFKKKQDT